MNNKLKQGFVVSMVVATSLFTQINDAIAKTLNNEEYNKAEKLANITDNTASAMIININTPDSAQIKAFFMEWNILTNDEKSEFNRLWNKATQSDLRHIYEKHIIRHFTWKYDDEGKLAFIVLTLGWEETILRPKCKAIIDWNPYYLYLYPKIKENIQWDISIYLLDEEGKKLDEEGKKLDEEGKKLDEDIKELEVKIKDAQKDWEQIKEDKKKADEYKKKVDEDKKKVEEMIKSLDEIEETFKNQKKE